MRLWPRRVAVAVPPPVRMLKPLFSFGVISDIQYADKECVVGRARYERDAIVKLHACVQHWNEYHKNTQPLKCIVNLGDIIDGHEGEEAVAKDKVDLQRVLTAFSGCDVPKYHVLGNHCVWNLGCEYIANELKMPHRFYDIPISNGWRFVFLDGTDLSLMKDSHSPAEAQEYFKLHSHRMLEDWNGGFSKKQMRWLKKIFEQAKENKEKLILFCHWPLLNLWTPDFEASLLWNAEEVLQMLDPEVVFMFMSGHMHENGYTLHKGIHHLTLGAIVTTPEGLQAHAVVHVGEHYVDIEGFGILESITQCLETVSGSSRERIE